MILNGQALLDAAPIVDMSPVKCSSFGVSWGLTESGVDIRIAESLWLHPIRRFRLSYSMEEFRMPDYLMGLVLNKSTWARRGLDASRTTNIEAGWNGHLTIELYYAGWKPLFIPAGVGIAQVIFLQISNPVRYNGRYQNQPARAVPAFNIDRSDEGYVHN